MPRLQRLLNELGDKTAIVFINKKKFADGLAKQLDKMGYRVTALHVGKTQEQHEIGLKGFRNKRFTVLVAINVAGHGIDIPNVAHVINLACQATLRCTPIELVELKGLGRLVWQPPS